MAQANKVCAVCKETGHSKFYCKKKPIKPIKSKAIQSKAKSPVKNTTKKVVKKETRGQLVKKFDAVFSRYIRLTSADEDGNATCVTCFDVKPWKELQNGHFFTRGRYPTRWDEANCHVQCYRCNVILNGNYIQYTKYMIDTYGREFIDELELKSLAPVKIPTPVLREYIAHYSSKVALLEAA